MKKLHKYLLPIGTFFSFALLTNCASKENNNISDSQVISEELSVDKKSTHSDKNTSNTLNQLPNYVKYNIDNPTKPQVLRTNAAILKFPLSKKDKNDIQILVYKYDNEKNIAGLAGPQIGMKALN